MIIISKIYYYHNRNIISKMTCRLYLILLSILNMDNVYTINYRYNDPGKEDYIDNTCNFNIIRFTKNDIMCIDYGRYKKYCNNDLLPEKFTIVNELGVGNKNIYTITPKIMHKKYYGYKYNVANYYYTFTCSDLDNEPRLLLRIYPVDDLSYIQEMCETIFVIVIIVVLLFLMYQIKMIDNLNFIVGYMFGIAVNTLITGSDIYYE